MPRWESSAITVNDFIRITIRDMQDAIEIVTTTDSKKSAKGSARITDLYDNTYQVDLQMVRGERDLWLEYYVKYEQTGRETRGRIDIDRFPCHFGGERYYFVCPFTGKPSYTLRLCRGHFMSRHYLSEIFRCRGAMPYRSQTTSGIDRDRQRVKVAERRAERKGVTTERGFYIKPKWMRHETFDKLIGDINREVERQNDGLMAALGAIKARIRSRN